MIPRCVADILFSVNNCTSTLTVNISHTKYFCNDNSTVIHCYLYINKKKIILTLIYLPDFPKILILYSHTDFRQQLCNVRNIILYDIYAGYFDLVLKCCNYV